MEVKKKYRRLLLSCVTILMCLSALVALAYILFTDNIKLVNHLNAGDLEVTLTRTNLTGKVFGPDGQLRDYSNNAHIDFSNPNDDNLFDLYKDAYIVPGVEYRAEMLVTNNGSTTFGYYIEIIVSEDSSPELCEQLYITITSGDRQVSGTLADLYLGTETDFISVIEANGSSTFDIEIIFKDNDNSNAAMDKTVYFDLVVNAVQIPSSTDSNNN